MGEIEQMLSDAETYRQQDTLTRSEMVVRESLKGYMNRLRKSMDDFDDTKLSRRDRDSIENKFADMEKWLKGAGEKSTKQECEEKQKEVEAAWNTTMIKINNSLEDFWDKQVAEVQKEKIVTVEQGGFFTKTGFDLRNLIDDPD